MNSYTGRLIDALKLIDGLGLEVRVKRSIALKSSEETRAKVRAAMNGTSSKGRSRLSAAKFKKVKRLLKEGYSQTDVAERARCSAATVGRISRGEVKVKS